MPNRILKESICTSDSIDTLGWFEEVLFYRLIVNCDDFGRFDGRVSIIKTRLFPLKENLTLKNVESAINKLARAGLVTPYESGGKPFLFLPSWNEHQAIRAKRSRYPEPEIICEHMHADESKCLRNPIQSESNPNPNTNARRAAAPNARPTLNEVKDYCNERHNSVDPQLFYDYYEANGWVQGKGKPIKDWKATVRTWENRNQSNGVKSTKSAGWEPGKARELSVSEQQRCKEDMDRMRRLMGMEAGT